MSQLPPSGTSYLKMSLGETLAKVNAESSLKFDKVVVGAAILRNDHRILLLKRRADEQHYPNVYEIPGGKVESSDADVMAAIIREVSEESSLTVTKVVKALLYHGVKIWFS